MGPVDYESMVLPERVERMDAVLSRRTRGITLLLENIHDPHNAAACLRSSEAFGVQDVHVIEGRNPFRPSRRVVQGSDKWLCLHRHGSTAEALSALRDKGYRIYTSDLRAARPLQELDFDRPCVLAFGNEHDGASPELVEAADERFIIPMRGFCESFNVSVAVALSLFHAVNRRFGAPLAVGDLPEADRAAIRPEWMRVAVKRGDEIAAAAARRDEPSAAPKPRAPRR